MQSREPSVVRTADTCGWVGLVLIALLGLAWPEDDVGRVQAQPADGVQAGPDAAEKRVGADPEQTDPADDDDAESGIGFPSDRVRERQMDRGRRLVAEQRWSDAATLFDEILASDSDSFFRADRQQRTWQSIKSQAHRLIGSLPKPGREAYELQFRARAERLLEQAVAANDGAGIVAVARRWFHTPAGLRATLLAAIESLEANQPLAAAAWLDRLALVDEAAAFEPTLSVMRAVAWLRAGDRAAAAAILERARTGGKTVARIAGKDVAVSYPAGGGLAWLTALVGDPVDGADGPGDGSLRGDWAMQRGEPARNGMVAASRPLLAPRYRVPLARHPEESRLLEAQRRARADQDIAVLPAGTPLAVDGRILVHTPMGLLAVDFETGKRVWLQTGPGTAGWRSPAAGSDVADPPDTDAGGAFRSVFEDATSGNMASDGELVFVVESHPDAGAPALAAGMNLRPGMMVRGGDWRGGNSLSAYTIANRGGLRWRLPAAGGGGDQSGDQKGPAADSTAWYLGAPLPVGRQLFVLVEERGEIRLDVLDAATGAVEWSQPFAELDEDRAIGNRESQSRRLAGLSPALAEGVLVCPTGAGAVVAVDLATRTLLWAHEYPQPRQSGVSVMPNGIRVGRAGLGGQGFPGEGRGDQRSGRWLDSTPVLAGGRALLTPGESQELHCLDLRQGTTAWRLPRRDRLFVAGVVDGRAIVAGRHAVEAIELATGRVAWQRAFAPDQGSLSGRGILTANRLFLPLDTPEVVEVDLDDGRVVGRSSSRGAAIPGNLLAYRGEVISQGSDSLDVFHQSAALEARIETALRQQPQDAWALLWRGQLDLDRGATARGIAAIREAHAIQPGRVPANVVAAALLFGLQRDFPAAAPLWREAVAMSGSSPAAVVVLRASVDGFLHSGDLNQAWEAAGELLAHATASGCVLFEGGPAGPQAAAESLIADGDDPALQVAPDRWLQGRLAELFGKAPQPLRAEMDAFVARESSAGAVAAPADGPGPAGLPDRIGDRPERIARLRRVIERFGKHEQALAARRGLVEALGEAIETSTAGDEARGLTVERDFALLDLARVGRPDDRAYAATLLAGIRAELPGGPAAVLRDGGADAWPIGRVAQRRGGVINVTVGGQGGRQRPADADDLRFLRSRLTTIPVLGGPDSFLPGLELAFDPHQQTGVVATDGFGRPLGEPFAMKGRSDAQRLMPMVQAGGMDEAAVLGRVAFIRVGASLAAFEMATAGETSPDRGRTRPLWMLADKAEAAGESRGGMFVMNVAAARMGRQGNLPLGARISEPRNADDAARRIGGPAWVPRATGVAVMADRMLRVHDPLTGRLLWERQRLPAASELIGDDEYLCVCPADGRGAMVLAMADGRLVRTLDLPASERRLSSSGRYIVAAEFEDATAGERGRPGVGGKAGKARVRLDRVDPVDGRRLTLGDYPGESRAASAGDGRLAVVEPSGALSVLDIGAAGAAFRTRLPDMPAGLEQLQVLPWNGRYLVLVGRAETPEEQRQFERIGSIAPLPGMPGREMPQLVTGSLWAVDAASGDMLWPVPATILRHSLQSQTGSQLPVLLFARTIQSAREPDGLRLSVLCLDKRTGQAVYVDDRFTGRSAGRPEMIVAGCGISGDPGGHTIALAHGRGNPELQLEFTGSPTAPRPPYQASARASGPPDPLGDLQYWINKALTLPLPF